MLKHLVINARSVMYICIYSSLNLVAHIFYHNKKITVRFEKKRN